MSSEDEFQEFFDSYPWEEHQEIEKIAWSHRSQILEASFMLETLLIATISHLLVGQDYPRFRLLRHLIFDAEFCTFMQLRKMLSMIFSIFGDQIACLSEEEGKVLRSEINKIIKVRNMFAHGMSMIDAETNCYSIRYYDNGIINKVIDESFVNEFLEKCTETRRTLSVLNEFFRDNTINIDAEVIKEETIT